MSTKSELLRVLEKNRNSYVSGEELAASLGVSRNSVWKAVKALRESGHSIDAVPNLGYCLREKSDKLSLEGIEAFMPQKSRFNIIIRDEVDSTNLEARRLANEGECAETIIIANTQTKGRGRLGRQFYSPADNGIYLSLLVKPKSHNSRPTLITTAAAVAVSRAIEKSTGKKPQIKWVNDLYLNNKKICGILTEAISSFETGEIEYIIVGIGVNCKPSELPDELSDIVGFVTEGDLFVPRNKIAAALIGELEKLGDMMQTGDFILEYKKKSMVIGHDIKILGAVEERATAIDIDENGGLVVRTKSGETKTLSSGEISIRLDNNAENKES